MIKRWLLLALPVILTGCWSLYGGGYSSYTPKDRTPACFNNVRVIEIDTMERWGASAKNLQGQVFQLTASNAGRETYILQRAAILAWQRGYKAFTILNSDETSYSYDKFIGGRMVEDTTTMKDSRGNVIGTATSTPRFESTTVKVTNYTRTMTVQILENEDDTQFKNMYLVAKYLPLFLRISGLGNKTGEVRLVFFKTSDFVEKRTAEGLIKDGVAFCEFVDDKYFVAPGQYYVALLTDYDKTKEEYSELYLFSNGKTNKELGISEDMDMDDVLEKSPKYTVTNQPIEFTTDMFF